MDEINDIRGIEIPIFDPEQLSPQERYKLELNVYYQINYFKNLMGSHQDLFKDYLRQEILYSQNQMSRLMNNTARLLSYEKNAPGSVAKILKFDQERLLIYVAELGALTKAKQRTKSVKIEDLFIDAIKDRTKIKARELADERIKLTVLCLKDFLDYNNKRKPRKPANEIIVPWHVLREFNIIRAPLPRGIVDDLKAWCLYFGQPLTDSQQRYFGDPPKEENMEKFRDVLKPLKMEP